MANPRSDARSPASALQALVHAQIQLDNWRPAKDTVEHSRGLENGWVVAGIFSFLFMLASLASSVCLSLSRGLFRAGQPDSNQPNFSTTGSLSASHTTCTQLKHGVYLHHPLMGPTGLEAAHGERGRVAMLREHIGGGRGGLPPREYRTINSSVPWRRECCKGERSSQNRPVDSNFNVPNVQRKV